LHGPASFEPESSGGLITAIARIVYVVYIADSFVVWSGWLCVCFCACVGLFVCVVACFALFVVFACCLLLRLLAACLLGGLGGVSNTSETPKKTGRKKRRTHLRVLKGGQPMVCWTREHLGLRRCCFWWVVVIQGTSLSLSSFCI
jgi:hypothetical protein